jgi:hypothetical protein
MMSKIKSVLKLKASVALQKEIDEELEKEDPQSKDILNELIKRNASSNTENSEKVSP